MLFTIEKYILLFFIYSIAGWIIEVVGKLIEKKKFINRGFLIGPYCPIYGYGSILITILLEKYTNDVIVLFFMSMVICALLEYLTSYFMEKIFHTRWWDYSRYKFNINGRICLETMIPFGLLGCFVMYVSNPFFIKLINYTPMNVMHVISIILLVIYTADNIISFNIIKNIKITAESLKDNTEEITKKVREVLYNKSASTRRIVDAFPNMQIIRDKIKKKIDKLK